MDPITPQYEVKGNELVLTFKLPTESTTGNYSPMISSQTIKLERLSANQIRLTGEHLGAEPQSISFTPSDSEYRHAHLLLRENLVGATLQ